MASPLVPLTVALTAAAADGAGLHRVAFYLVLLAIPAAAGAALAATGDHAEGRPATARIACSSAALALLVLSSATRANAVAGAVPPLALAALVGALSAYALLGVAWVVWAPSPAAREG